MLGATQSAIERIPDIPPKVYAEELPVAPVVVEPPPPVVKKDAVACNCYLYVKGKYPTFPNTKDLKPNTTPSVGVVALFDYGNLNHYAIVTKLEAEGFWVKDSNFGGCGYRTHFIRWNDPNLVGFWGVVETPQTPSS